MTETEDRVELESEKAWDMLAVGREVDGEG